MTIVLLVTLSGILLFSYLHTSNTIYRTSWGFFPSEITIPIGTEVTFVNMTDTLMWPASDIHPSHSIYPEFDPRRGIKPDESWSFTFDKRGQWVFHDHLSTHYTGLVKVYDESGESSFFCEDGENSQACWAASVEYSLRNEGVVEAFDLLAEIHRKNPEFATICHNYTHDIGLKTFVVYGTDFELSGKTSYCNAGFFHGYMEGLISNVDDLTKAEEFCLRADEEIGDDFPLAEEQCRHGIGHGVLEHFIITRPDLLSSPSALIQEAVTVCEATNDTFDHLMRCTSGAFNVYRDFVVLNDDYSEYVQRENLYNVCTVSDEKHVKEACYWELSKVLADTGPIRELLSGAVRPDNSDAYVIDMLFPEADRDRYLPFATRSWAFIVGKFAVTEYSADATIRACDIVPGEAKLDCLRGVFEGAFSSGEPYNEQSVLTRLCTSDELSGNETDLCYEQFQMDVKQTYNIDDYPTFCEVVPEEHHDPQVCGRS